MRLPSPVLPVLLAVALMALADVRGLSARQPGFARMSTDLFDVLPPSARVRGVPGAMTVQPQACRTMPAAEIRRRIVDVAVQEWGFFGFSTRGTGRWRGERDGGERQRQRGRGSCVTRQAPAPVASPSGGGGARRFHHRRLLGGHA